MIMTTSLPWQVLTSTLVLRESGALRDSPMTAPQDLTCRTMARNKLQTASRHLLVSTQSKLVQQISSQTCAPQVTSARKKLMTRRRNSAKLALSVALRVVQPKPTVVIVHQDITAQRHHLSL